MNLYAQKVSSWIRSGQNYNQGLMLLVEIDPKHHLLPYLSSGKKDLLGKLTHEICKTAGLANTLTWKKFVQDVKDAPIPNASLLPVVSTLKIPVITIQPIQEQKRILVPPELQVQNASHLRAPEFAGEVDNTADSLKENPLKDYPPIIRRIIHEYASAFQERSKLHTVMVEMDPSNAPAVMVKRAELFDLIKALSIRLEELYNAKEKFETDGTLPPEAELFPAPEPPVDEISNLSEEDLKKRKKLLQNGNSKDQSFLDYQSKEHGATRNPMPTGPKRTKMELRIKERNKLIQQIDTSLLKYAVKE